MKIHRTDNLHPSQPDTARIAPETAGTRFQEVLRDAACAVPGIQNPGVVHGIPPAGSGTGFRVMGERDEILSRAEDLLDLLESLQRGIAGAGLPPRDACDFVRAVEDRVDELGPLVERLPEGDRFRDFINRIVVTASVEAIKFRRGDYR